VNGGTANRPATGRNGTAQLELVSPDTAKSPSSGRNGSAQLELVTRFDDRTGPDPTTGKERIVRNWNW